MTEILILITGFVVVVSCLAGIYLALSILRVKSAQDEIYNVEEKTVNDHADMLEDLYWLAVHAE